MRKNENFDAEIAKKRSKIINMNQWSKITIKNQTLDCKGYVMNRRKKENSLLYGQTLTNLTWIISLSEFFNLMYL